MTDYTKSLPWSDVAVGTKVRLTHPKHPDVYGEIAQGSEHGWVVVNGASYQRQRGWHLWTEADPEPSYEHGAYTSRHNHLWQMDIDDSWYTVGRNTSFTTTMAEAKEGPFTRLMTEAEWEATRGRAMKLALERIAEMFRRLKFDGENETHILLIAAADALASTPEGSKP